MAHVAENTPGLFDIEIQGMWWYGVDQEEIKDLILKLDQLVNHSTGASGNIHIKTGTSTCGITGQCGPLDNVAEDIDIAFLEARNVEYIEVSWPDCQLITRICSKGCGTEVQK